MLKVKDAASLTKRQRWAALAMLAGSLLVVMMDMTILIMALPEMVAELSPTSSQQLWIVDMYSLVLAGLLIPMSALADRWGRKRTLLTGFAIFGVVSLLVLVATSTGAVIALRAVLGAAGAMIMPTTLSMIRSIFHDPAERARALAVWSVILSIGGIIGPLVGGSLLEFFTWHSAFLINVPFVAVALGFGIFLLPESRNPDPPRWDLPAAALSMAGMAGLVWGIKEIAKNGWGDTTAWGVTAAAVLVMTVFVRRCLNRPDPLLDVRLFRSKPFTAGTVAALTASIAMAGVVLLIAQWLQNIAGFKPVVAGLAMMPMALGSLVMGPLAPRLAARIGTRNALAGGLALTGIGLLWLFAAGDLHAYWQLIGPLALVGAGVGSLAIASAIIMGSTPPEKAGNAAAIEEAMYDFGSVLGIAVLGSIASALYRIHLGIQDFAPRGITGQLATQADESVVGALNAARETGLADLADTAAQAFGSALSQTSLIGGIVMVGTALAVRALVPKEFDIAGHNSK
ncbi:MFS transporter [Streptomyces sp. NPDC059255]|uniref:MFS transporter n=1 Tax=Streptomyces sp. NPDC059255 TaxID=3346793 RepID=UPI003687CBB8